MKFGWMLRNSACTSLNEYTQDTESFLRKTSRSFVEHLHHKVDVFLRPLTANTAGSSSNTDLSSINEGWSHIWTDAARTDEDCCVCEIAKQHEGEGMSCN